ncbi:MAG: NADH:ubiquinone reductase (Na(+)-transporting) subunit C [Candidatus Omnitrophota bacterium]
MDKNSNSYTFTFALGVCIVCSFLLALVSEGLRPQKEINEALDVKRNILRAVGVKAALEPQTSGEEILQIYDRRIEEQVINDRGEVVDGQLPEAVRDGDQLYPLYIYKDGGRTEAYAFPIVGKGLWSTIYGYLAIESDAVTVRGVAFYKHGETPGLGGEIETRWFQDQFKGKKIYDVDDQELVPIRVVKGKVEDQLKPDAAEHAVDGISGATLTGKGITQMLDKWIRVYERYFEKVRNGQ